MLAAESAVRERIGGGGVEVEAKPLSGILAKLKQRKQAVVAKCVHKLCKAPHRGSGFET